MGRLIRYGAALLRGLLFRLIQFFRSDLSVGKQLLVFRNASVMARGGGALTLGNGVKIRRNAIVSALNGGKIVVGDNVVIGTGNSIVCHQSITIGKGTLLAPGVMIYDHDHVFDKENGINRKSYKTSEVTIGENCWIGANTIILRGTQIGDNCVIGAGSVIKGVFLKGSLVIQPRQTEVREIVS